MRTWETDHAWGAITHRRLRPHGQSYGTFPHILNGPDDAGNQATDSNDVARSARGDDGRMAGVSDTDLNRIFPPHELPDGRPAL